MIPDTTHFRFTLEELEETARLQLLCPAPSLTAAQIDELRQTFGAHW